jgi:ferric-dicitrate binding protein FerR (iron transport regulator)
VSGFGMPVKGSSSAVVQLRKWQGMAMVFLHAETFGDRVRTFLTIFALALPLSSNSATSQAVSGAVEAGTTVVARNKVTGLRGQTQRELAVGDRVHRDELIRTGTEAQAEFKLDDNTRLAVGPDAELRVDAFVIGGGSDPSAIAVRLLKGTLRFLTGRQSSESYNIETPSATIGVRGTIFDLYVSAEGETFVLMHQGLVEVCTKGRVFCRKHRAVGRIVQVTKSGMVSDPNKWSAESAGGVTAGQAFPFVGRRLEVDPVPRMTHNAITHRK